ncbi:MAG: hypothetical protein Q4D16_23640 [Eubacteriales bacterium]|nr:hypothetical protein [Eubacteriales bacterium]
MLKQKLWERLVIMNTKEHETLKARGSADLSYLGKTVDWKKG